MWEEVAVGMRVGGRRTVLVPPSASLRPRKKGRALLAPPGETMRFECELRSIESGVTALAVRSGLLGVGSVAAPLALIALTNWLCCLLWAGLPPPGHARSGARALAPSLFFFCWAHGLLALFGGSVRVRGSGAHRAPHARHAHGRGRDTRGSVFAEARVSVQAHTERHTCRQTARSSPALSSVSRSTGL